MQTQRIKVRRVALHRDDGGASQFAQVRGPAKEERAGEAATAQVAASPPKNQRVQERRADKDVVYDLDWETREESGEAVFTAAVGKHAWTDWRYDQDAVVRTQDEDNHMVYTIDAEHAYNVWSNKRGMKQGELMHELKDIGKSLGGAESSFQTVAHMETIQEYKTAYAHANDCFWGRDDGDKHLFCHSRVAAGASR